MNIIFIILCVIHLLVWLFVVTAFLNKKTAEINLYYLIPFIYIVHMFPFHMIIETEKIIYPESRNEKAKEVENYLLIPNIYNYLRDNLFKNSFANPVSAQGLLIFGAITSAYTIIKNCNNN